MLFVWSALFYELTGYSKMLKSQHNIFKLAVRLVALKTEGIKLRIAGLTHSYET